MTKVTYYYPIDQTADQPDFDEDRNQFMYAEEIKVLTGFNPDEYGLIALNLLGIYPVIFPYGNPVNPIFIDEGFNIRANIVDYDTTAPDNDKGVWWSNPMTRTEEEEVTTPNPIDYLWWGQLGSYAVAGFEPQQVLFKKFAIPAIAQRVRTVLGILKQRRDAYRRNNLSRSGESPLLASLNAALLDSVAIDEARIRALSTVTDSAGDVNDIVSPAFGTIQLMADVANPRNFLGGDFVDFQSYRLSKSDFELHFPQENVTIPHDYINNGFGGGAFTMQADTTICQIRRISNGFIVDEILVEDFTQTDAAGYAAAVAADFDNINSLEFGYIRYNQNDYFKYFSNVDESPVLDAIAVMRAALHNSRFTGPSTFTSIDFANNLIDANSDASAAALGVAPGQLYRDGDTVKIRLGSVDETHPTILMSVDDSNLTTGETATVTITLSEASSNFTVDDLLVSGGSLSNFSGSGASYTVTFTPFADSHADGIVTVPVNSFTDANGNFNEETASVTITVDTLVITATYTVTVAGGVFEIDGVAQDSLTLVNGATYRFNQDDASNTGHPFRIYNSYQDELFEVNNYVLIAGTPGTATSYTQWTVPMAGDYYYGCPNHENMGGTITVA